MCRRSFSSKLIDAFEALLFIQLLEDDHHQLEKLLLEALFLFDDFAGDATDFKPFDSGFKESLVVTDIFFFNNGGGSVVLLSWFH